MSQPIRTMGMQRYDTTISGHQARVVALGGIAKRKGVSSRASLLISVNRLWVTMSSLVTKLGKCPLALPLKHKRKRSKAMKLRIKGNEWARNNNIHDKEQLALYKGTHRQDLHFHVITAAHNQTLTPCHLIHLHDLDWLPPGKHPKLRKNTPIGHPKTFFKLELSNCITSLSIFLGKGGV